MFLKTNTSELLHTKDVLSLLPLVIPSNDVSSV